MSLEIGSFFNQIDNKSLFLYIIIFVIFLFFAKNTNVTLSVIFFVTLAFIICYYLHRTKNKNANKNTEFNSDKNLIKKYNLQSGSRRINYSQEPKPFNFFDQRNYPSI